MDACTRLSAVGRLAFMLFLGLGTVMIAAPTVAPAETADYVNLGFQIAIPQQFRKVDGDDRRTIFEDASGAARITVFRGEVASGTRRQDIEAVVAGADWIDNVTYRRAGDSWFVLSGLYRRDPGDRDLTIFYFKAMLNGDRTRYSAFEISYPTSLKTQFDPIVTRIEKSLRPPA